MPPFLTDRRTLAFLSVVAILASLVSIIASRHPAQPEVDTDLHRTAGQVFAEETVKTLTNGDGLVLVVPVCSSMPLRAVDLQVEGFEKALKQLGRGRIIGREKIIARTPQTDDLLTADAYLRIAQKYPSANAIVCFAGIKPFGETDLTEAAGKTPLCVFSMSEPVQKELIAQGIVRLAVIPRGWAEGESAADAPPRPNHFNDYYAIIKP